MTHSTEHVEPVGQERRPEAGEPAWDEIVRPDGDPEPGAAQGDHLRDGDLRDDDVRDDLRDDDLRDDDLRDDDVRDGDVRAGDVRDGDVRDDDVRHDDVRDGSTWAASDVGAARAEPDRIEPAERTAETDTLPGDGATVLPRDAEPATGRHGEDRGWHDVQSRFVDDPAAAVQEAADLVDAALRDLRGTLPGAGDRGSTEDLRLAFRRYRDVYQSLSGT